MQMRIFERFGAEISGMDIATARRSDAADIAALVARHRVVVLRNQTCGDADFVRFLAAIGPLTFTDGEVPVADAPDLNIVTNIGRSTPPRSVFHTDTSYVQRPPSYSALRAVILPDAGGCTLFSDQVRAATDLPEAIRNRLTGRTLMHSTTARDGRPIAARHPILRRHPATGEIALYLTTPERCSDLDGMDAATSARIVAILYKRSIKPSAVYRHHWRPGDIVIWDNRTTMHRADHGDVVGDRVLHRGLVQGEAPVAVGDITLSALAA